MKKKTTNSDSIQRSRINNKTEKLVLTALFTALIAVCSMITIPTTIPFTLQTLAVCLSGGVLGLKRGTLSVIVYILLGLAGAPVFSGFKAGPSVLMSPTGGYIIGFIATVAVVGFVSDKLGTKIWISLLSMSLGVLLCYLFGTVWFIILYSSTKGDISIIKVLSICVFPFIAFDALKIAVAAVLTNRLKRIIRN